MNILYKGALVSREEGVELWQMISTLNWNLN